MSEKENKDGSVEYSVETALKEAELAVMRYEEGAGKDDTEAAREAIEADNRRKMAKGKGDVQQVLKMVEARRMLWRVLEWSHVMHLSFHPDAKITAFREGQRDIGLRLVEIINDADPNAYYQMAREHASDLKNEEERKRKEMEALQK